MIEDCKKFFSTIKDLESYLVEFEEDKSMKRKENLDDCAMSGNKHWLVIVIIHNECIFSANDGIWKAWTQIRNTFLRPKRWGLGIIVSDFLFLFDRLNHLSLSEEIKREVMDKTGLTIIETVELFEYGKSNEGYWDGPRLHKKVVNKALPIAKALYPSYPLLFLFDNDISYFVFAQDALHTIQMNKSTKGQQYLLYNRWFKKDVALII